MCFKALGKSVQLFFNAIEGGEREKNGKKREERYKNSFIFVLKTLGTEHKSTVSGPFTRPSKNTEKTK